MPATIITFIIGIIIGFVIAWFILPLRQSDKKPEFTKAPNYNQQKKKQENKERIVEYIKEHGKATNNDIETLLGVSDATATNYLQELEDEGTIKQVGKQGRSVHYELRPPHPSSSAGRRRSS